ncbi:unnamed protein product [Arabidopsis arenosa]|uniref:Uncharacterized protein n=1 Tax=Arabidopsis arenosa TaxID=38785 RepID=A0A8S2AJE0_ARAAE|nr:unnamed protein product [Arabidopsis arenosa]
MRSLLLSRLCLRSKPSPLRHQHLGGVRFMSETSLCHIVGAEHCGSTPRDGDIGKLVINDYTESSSGTIKASLSGQCSNMVYYIENNGRGIVNLENNDHDRIFRTYPAPYFIPPQSSSY